MQKYPLKRQTPAPVLLTNLYFTDSRNIYLSHLVTELGKLAFEDHSVCIVEGVPRAEPAYTPRTLHMETLAEPKQNIIKKDQEGMIQNTIQCKCISTISCSLNRGLSGTS